MLLPEERTIMYCLSQYESILMDQAIKFLHTRPKQTAQKIIRGLRKQHRISFLHEGSYIGAGPISKADSKTEEAIWVLLRYIDQIGPMDHRKADYPSQIYFIRNEVSYEIIVLRAGEQRLTAHLHPREGLKYIIIVPDESMIPAVRLPDAPCMFATVTYGDGDIPEVTFYLQEEQPNV
jgi:hypothetical protein